MKNTLEKENLYPTLKKVFTYVLILGALITGFTVGRYTQNYPPKQVDKQSTNHYSHAFTPDEVSIAVNESNELILIERKTGEYIVYSDKIGMTIFKMYTSRIYQNAIGK